MGRKTRPARTPEQREAQLVNLAMDSAEKLMNEGKASSQVITHFLKLGTLRNQLEIEKLRKDTELSSAKIKTMELQQRSDEKYEQALNAFRIYSGDEYGEEEEYYD